jgi:hypothetical protein
VIRREAGNLSGMLTEATRYFRSLARLARLTPVTTKRSKTKATNMKSTPIRKPAKDILLAPGNAALHFANAL